MLHTLTSSSAAAPCSVFPCPWSTLLGLRRALSPVLLALLFCGVHAHKSAVSEPGQISRQHACT
jgi:hypothetical protein